MIHRSLIINTNICNFFVPAKVGGSFSTMMLVGSGKLINEWLLKSSRTIPATMTITFAHRRASLVIVETLWGVSRRMMDGRLMISGTTFGQALCLWEANRSRMQNIWEHLVSSNIFYSMLSDYNINNQNTRTLDMSHIPKNYRSHGSSGMRRTLVFTFFLPYPSLALPRLTSRVTDVVVVLVVFVAVLQLLPPLPLFEDFVDGGCWGWLWQNSFRWDESRSRCRSSVQFFGSIFVVVFTVVIGVGVSSLLPELLPFDIFIKDVG